MNEELDKDLQELLNECFDCLKEGQKIPAVGRINRRLRLLDSYELNTSPAKMDCIHCGLLCTLSGEQCTGNGCYEVLE